ncbi:unnamed protein product [Rhizophagus irregularis]|nr:unnamed protein product [Rhizophagus irregularis]
MWAGIFLMIIGELGNFMAYAFAPASDLMGIFIAIIGAVVVVVNSKSDEVKLTPEAIWTAIKETQFIIYFIITVTLAIFLMYLSDKIGHKTCFVDLSLVAIFGGYTIRFLNKALKQFDSTEVIPIQFVLFTISAIIGSAVLYNDFADMNFWKFTGFFIGCILTFVGVYFITSNRSESEGYSHPVPNNLSSGSVRSSRMVDPLRAVLPVFPDELNGSSGSGEFNRQYSSFNQSSVATGIPRRHTLTEPTVLSSTPLLNGYSSLRNDGILRSLGVSATSLTAGVSQALNSVGARHSHALGLEQVFENYKGIGKDYGAHSSKISSPLATNAEDDTVKVLAHSQNLMLIHLRIAILKYSDYTDTAQTDDDARTISGWTISTNGSNIGNLYR